MARKQTVTAGRVQRGQRGCDEVHRPSADDPSIHTAPALPFSANQHPHLCPVQQTSMLCSLLQIATSAGVRGGGGPALSSLPL